MKTTTNHTSTNRLSVVKFAALVVSVIVLATVVGALGFQLLQGDQESTQPFATDSRITFQSIEALVSASQFVIVATLVDERTEPVKEQSTVDTSHQDSRMDVVRRFSVTQSLKGSLIPTEIEVRSAASARVEISSGKFIDAQYEVVPIVKGESYVLFLRSISDPALGPYLATAGEPGIAELDGLLLYFKTTSGYRSDLSRLGTALGRAQAPAQFDVDLSTVSAAVR